MEMSAGTVLDRVLGDLVTVWLGWQQGVLHDQPDAVHQLRVTSRRLRAAVRLWEPYIAADREPRQLARQWRWAARSLGAARDLEVLIDHVNNHLADLEVSDEERDTVQRWLQTELVPEQRRALERVKGVLGTDRWQSLAERMAAAAADTWVADGGITEPWQGLVDPVVDQCHRVLAAWDRGTDADLPLNRSERDEALHHTRRLAKTARYGAEALSALAPGLTGLAQSSTAVADALGVVQDSVVARHWLTPQIDESTSDGVFQRLLTLQDEARTAAMEQARRAIIELTGQIGVARNLAGGTTT